MSTVKVLTVCGSGTVSSSMVSLRIKDFLAEHGFKVAATEINPGGVASALSQGSYDFIAYTSPIHGKIDIPAINAVCLLTGFGEEAFFEEVLEVLKKIK